MARNRKKQKSNGPKKGRAQSTGGPASAGADPAHAEPEDETPVAADADPQADDSPEAEAAVAGADPQDVPLDIEDAPLQVDEPVDERSADVLSADPAARLIASGEIHAALEALLFTSPDPLSVTKLSRALGDVPAKDVREALGQLAAEYDQQGRGFRIVEVSGGFQMATRERFAEYILRLGSKKKQAALSGAMLETLAIIAYRQPVIRAVVESIRGVESSGVVRNLLDLELIEVVGRKEVIGRPQMYGTTEKFLRAFGLRGIEDLPSIRGLREKLEAEEAEAARREREEREARERGAAEAGQAAADAGDVAPDSSTGEEASAPPFDDEADDADGVVGDSEEE